MDEQAKLRYLKDIEYFSAKLEKSPTSKVFMPLALAYLRLEKFDEVINVCQAGLDHSPDYIAAKTVMAQAFLGKGLREEAKGLLIEVATLNKNNYRANRLLGEIYRAEENPEKALYYYRTALINAPEDSELRRLIEEIASITDLKPSTLEEIEYEQKNTEDQVGGSTGDDLLDEANALSDELAESGLMEETIETDTDEVEDVFGDSPDPDDPFATMLFEGDFDGAREFVHTNYADDAALRDKKLKEIETEEAMLASGDFMAESLDLGDSEEDAEEIQNEIIIPDEEESDGFDLDNVFGDDFGDTKTDVEESNGSSTDEIDLAAEMDLDLISDEEIEAPEEIEVSVTDDPIDEIDLGMDFETEEEVDIAGEMDPDLVSDEEVEAPIELEKSLADAPAVGIDLGMDLETENEEVEPVLTAEEELNFDDILDEKIDQAEAAEKVEDETEINAESETEVEMPYAVAVEKLEGWMTNITKSKSGRNVH